MTPITWLCALLLEETPHPEVYLERSKNLDEVIATENHEALPNFLEELESAASVILFGTLGENVKALLTPIFIKLKLIGVNQLSSGESLMGLLLVKLNSCVLSNKATPSSRLRSFHWVRSLRHQWTGSPG